MTQQLSETLARLQAVCPTCHAAWLPRVTEGESFFARHANSAAEVLVVVIGHHATA